MEFDIIIIGAGPGGYETAVEAAKRGYKVAIVERRQVGGTCLNRGCIPTKALCASAAAYATARDATTFGINITGEIHPDLAGIMQRKNDVVQTLRDGVTSLLSHPNITVIQGEARLADNNAVEVNGETLHADNIILATGSKPRSLPIAGSELAITSDELLDIDKLPSSMVIVGGGVIGMEFAYIFSTLGTSVTVVEYCKEILPPFDSDIAKRLRTTLSRRGIKFAVGVAVTSIARDSEGLVVNYETKGKTQQVMGDVVLMAVGRAPVLPAGLDTLGIHTERGAIVTDNDYRTTADGVWAIGDVNARCMLAHAARAQGKHVLNAISGNIDSTIEFIPSAVFTVPEVAMVGKTEQSLKEKEVNYIALKSFFRANGKALAMGEPDGLVKVLVEESGKILGCHIMGAHAADIIHEITLAMTNGLTIDDIRHTIHTHPTLSEVLVG
mgnify:CR=1 FL=1